MIIFEGEELLLHYHEGESDTIFITFASADQTEKAHSEYFLKSIVEKYNLSCLGITTKFDNYYQHSDMFHIIPLCNEISQKYKKIIIIGLSMAAYAALKFSAELHADIVFAMGARYTLDANVAEVSGIMQRTVDRLDSHSISETTIQPHEVSGKLYIAHDTYQGQNGYNAIDHDHVYKLINNLPNTVLVPVLFAHHLVVNSLKGSEEFKSILDVLVTGDDNAVIEQVVKIRRHHINNINSKVLLFKNRYPLLIYKLLMSKTFYLIKNNHYLFDNHENNLLIIYNLWMKGYHAEGYNLLRICYIRAYLNCSFYEANEINKDYNKKLNHTPIYLPYLISCNRYILVFDQIQKKIIAVRDFLYDANYLPIRVYRHQSHHRLVCVCEDMIFELCYNQEKFFFKPLNFNEQSKDTILVETDKDTVIIYTPDHKYCFQVDLGGNSGFRLVTPNQWEKFAIVG